MKTDRNQPKIAIVCDWLTNWGGAEKCIWALHEMYPDAPIFTLIYNDKKMPEFKNADIRTSYLQKMPLAKKKWAFWLNFMPQAVESFDLSEYDIVISTSHVISKGIITKPSTLHICYLYSPTRYLWDYTYLYLKELRPFKFAPLDFLAKKWIAYSFNKLRTWDYLAGQRPDKIVSISHYIRKRTEKYYRRTTDVIYPPCNAKLFVPVKEIDNSDATVGAGYFLIVGRQVAYKRTDIVIKAFNELGLPLVVIGDGPELKKLKGIAKSNIRILGRLPDSEVKDYYARCRAFIFPQEEDFGITPLEAQASGRPVIAYRAGGALETVVEGKTGIFFDEQTPESIIEVIKNFDEKKFNPKTIREHALKFDTTIFKKEIADYVENSWKDFHKKR